MDTFLRWVDCGVGGNLFDFAQVGRRRVRWKNCNRGLVDEVLVFEAMEIAMSGSLPNCSPMLLKMSVQCNFAGDAPNVSLERVLT